MSDVQIPSNRTNSSLWSPSGASTGAMVAPPKSKQAPVIDARLGGLLVRIEFQTRHLRTIRYSRWHGASQHTSQIHPKVAFGCPKMSKLITFFTFAHKMIYFPMDFEIMRKKLSKRKKVVILGCFGASPRPLATPLKSKQAPVIEG